MEQITNMGNIFSKASFTIVALYGVDCHAGLPGVQASSSGRSQLVQRVQNMSLVSGLPSLDEALRHSGWDKRGWCYQEEQLSRRLLFITRQCVYYRCNRVLFREDSGFGDLSEPTDAFHHRARGEYYPVWNSYKMAVFNFTGRTLSYEADTINAFTGVASIFQHAFKGDFLYGLPETELDSALIWDPLQDSHRLVDKSTGVALFPSWSWAGWSNQTYYSFNAEEEDSRVEWQFTSPDGNKVGLCTSNELRAPKKQVQGDWERVRPDKRNKPTYYREHTNPYLWCRHPVAPKSEREARVLVQPNSQVLTFQAYVVKLRVSNSYQLNNSDKDYENFNEKINILDDDGVYAGQFSVPNHMLQELKEERQELVCLSRTNSWHAKDWSSPAPAREDDFKDVPPRDVALPRPSDISGEYRAFDCSVYDKNKPWALYNVMVIEWKDGIAYRMAVGLMHVDAFIRSNPVKKLIPLA